MYLIRVSFTVSHGDTRIVSWKRYVLYIKPVIICLYVIEGIIADLCEWIIDRRVTSVRMYILTLHLLKNSIFFL